jgi:hypothetical protein
MLWIVMLLLHCHYHFSSSRLFAAASSSSASSTEPRLPRTAFEALLNSAVLAAGEDISYPLEVKNSQAREHLYKSRIRGCSSPFRFLSPTCFLPLFFSIPPPSPSLPLPPSLPPLFPNRVGGVEGGGEEAHKDAERAGEGEQGGGDEGEIGREDVYLSSDGACLQSLSSY